MFIATMTDTESKSASNVKYSTSIKIIVYGQLFLGQYTNFSSNNVIKTVMMSYCILFNLLSCFRCYYYFTYTEIMSPNVFDSVAVMTLFKLFYCITTSLIFLLGKGKNFNKFLNTINLTGPNCLLQQQDYMSIISLCAFSVMVIRSTVQFLYYSISEGHDFLFFFAMSLLSLQLNLTNLKRIIVFEHLWCKFKSLRKTILKDLDFASNADDDAVMELNIKKLEDFINIYEKIIDSMRYVGHVTKFLILIGLPSFFLYIYYFIIKLTTQIYTSRTKAIVADFTILYLVTLVTAVLVELGNAEIDKIKTFLRAQLIHITYSPARNRVIDALKYLELRPYKYSIWRIFYLDISLPLFIISACTSYTIIVIQFLQIY